MSSPIDPFTAIAAVLEGLVKAAFEIIGAVFRL